MSRNLHTAIAGDAPGRHPASLRNIPASLPNALIRATAFRKCFGNDVQLIRVIRVSLHGPACSQAPLEKPGPCPRMCPNSHHRDDATNAAAWLHWLRGPTHWKSRRLNAKSSWPSVRFRWVSPLDSAGPLRSRHQSPHGSVPTSRRRTPSIWRHKIEQQRRTRDEPFRSVLWLQPAGQAPGTSQQRKSSGTPSSKPSRSLVQVARRL